MARSKRPVNSKTKFGDLCVLGIDPDVNNTGVCVVDEGKMVAHYLVVPESGREEKRVRMAHALSLCLKSIMDTFYPNRVVIEWQGIRPGDPRPNDILELCCIGAACLGMVSPDKFALFPLDILTPLPVQWKGSVSKKIHQPKILTCAGLTLDAFSHLPKGKVNHVVDALGLAIWGTQ